MLTQEEKANILRDFPNVKLSYEKIIHKKVYPLKDDYLLVIPDGKKCFAWFTSFNDKPVCFILELDNKNKKVIKIKNPSRRKEICILLIISGFLGLRKSCG
jgi:hypothetical protein